MPHRQEGDNKLSNTESDRRRQFDQALRAEKKDIARDLKIRRALTEETLHELYERLDAFQEEAFQRAYSGATPYEPKSEFKRRVKRVLCRVRTDAMSLIDLADQESMKKEVEEKRAAILQLKKSLIDLLDKVEQGPPYGFRAVRPRVFSSRPQPGEPLHTWRGADARITDQPFPAYKGGSTLVVTRHAQDLGGLFYKLVEIGRGVLVAGAKEEFFGRMADTVKEQIDVNSDPESSQDVLVPALREAISVANDWLDRIQAAQDAKK